MILIQSEEMSSKEEKERRKQLHQDLAKKALDFDDYVILIFLRMPGAIILWLVSGFKYKLRNMVKEKGDHTREWILSIILYAIIIGILVVINN